MTLLSADDLFIPEFTETATVDGVSGVEVISSEVDAETKISELGSDMDIDASLIVRSSVAVDTDDLVSFRGTSYRVAKAVPDSANVTKRIYLTSRYGGA
jgi:hypothetical protein